MQAIATNIRRTRETRNYTQEYVAYRLNISQNALSKIELGHTRITVERLLQIAEILDCNALDLIKLN